MVKYKTITKKRKKEILNKESCQMTAFEVLKAIPVGSSDLSNFFNSRFLWRSFESPPFSAVWLFLMYRRPLKDSERLLIAGQLRLICERGLIAAQIIENGLVER